MFSKRSLGGIWKPKNPHSLEYLKYLHGVLNKNAVVTENNRSLLVEALRAIAEILIWGDQNDPSVFDFFLEKNMLGYFLRIMKQKCGRYVCTQLLQTLNILFENISNETSLYYLLSNNHVNSIITHRFDFSDEEILAYYISFLKTLSLKLNNNTIHFFFNEHTNDFPLYTEAIKFFNHSESMVRIAVRTLTLNVYRVCSLPVNDSPMLNFIRDNAAAPYFSNFVFFIANHVVDIDSCLSAADGSSLHTRDKLRSLMAEHLDHIHYMNDVLCLNIDSLNAVLTEQLLKKLFVPIYLACLSSEYRFEGVPRISSVVALFLLSQVFLVVTHTPLVERLASLLVLGDRGALCNEGAVLSSTGSDCVESTESNITDEEKLSRNHTPRIDDPLTAPDALSERPLLRSVLESLDCSRDDHSAFFTLCLIYSIYQNTGISPALLQCAQLTPENSSNGAICLDILKRLVKILSLSVEKDCRVRVATLDTTCVTFKQILCNPDGQYNSIIDQFLADLVSAREVIIAQLRDYVQHEDLFLDLFEDEYRQMQAKSVSISLLCADPAMLLPPSDTPLSGVDFVKRLPCGPQEHARRAIRVFLLIRELLQDISGEEDDFHIAFTASPLVKVDDCLNLNNSDLLACTVAAKDGTKSQRFLVTGGLQLMLVEPDTKKLGWGVVRFVGFLQDCEVNGDKEDSRALSVVVLAPAAKARANSHQLLSAKLIFDDHIRCMAAKQRLTKGRQKARQYKMDVISHLLELRGSSEKSGEILLPPPPLLSNVVGRQALPGYVAIDHSRRRTTNEGDNEASSKQPAKVDSSKADSVRKPSMIKQPSRRRVRVLSAECVNVESSENAQSPLVDESGKELVDEMEKVVAAPAEMVEIGIGTAASRFEKRSSSLSPRVVPRFGVDEQNQRTPPPVEKRSVGSLLSGRGRIGGGTRIDSQSGGGGIEMTRVREESLHHSEDVEEGPPITERMARVEIREDPGTEGPQQPSLQCFAGKRRVSSQVLDI